MIPALAIFFIGMAILLISANLLIKQAVRLSLAMRLSPLIIGSTVVAVGTSLPELGVSLASAASGDTGLAVGNLVGSNIANILLILPFAILTGRLHIGTIKTQRNVWYMGFVTLVFILFYFRLWSLASAVILLSLSLIFICLEYFWGVLGRVKEDAKQFVAKQPGSLHYSIFFLIVSVIGIIVGGLISVNGVELIAKVSGVSTSILGLTLTAVATSMPELLVSVLGEKHHQDKLVLGNIIGSNVFNLAFIGGLLVLISHPPIISGWSWFFLAFSTIGLIFLVGIYKGQTFPKWIAPVLFLLFGGYLFSLVQVE